MGNTDLNLIFDISFVKSCQQKPELDDLLILTRWFGVVGAAEEFGPVWFGF